MRKWTYLVAALLIGGTAATVTSCIDNEEPAGITELRGAKAELLKAKAQVEVAEAAIKTAQANLLQAKADLKAEEVAQEKLRTELLAAQTEDAKKAIEEAAAVRAEEAKAALIAAQQAAAEADYAYQKALLEISLRLSTMKSDVYAEALKELLVDKEYTYQYYEYTYEEVTEYVTVGDEKVKITYYKAEKAKEPTTVTVSGFISLSSELANIEYEIASLMQSKAEFEFSYKEEDLQKKYGALKAYWEGVQAGQTEALAAYKKIQGIDIADWEASYKALAAEIEAAKVAKDAIEKKLAEDIVPLDKQRAELENKFGEVSELKIEVPAGMEFGVINALRTLARAVAYPNESLSAAILDVINNQASYDEAKREWIIADNAFTIKLSASDKNTLFTTRCFSANDGSNVDVNILKYFESRILTSENEAQAKRQLQIYETNLVDATQPYTDALKTWEDARDAFIAAADKYKYNYKSSLATHKYDAYAVIQTAINGYLDKTTPTAAETTAIKTTIANFLTQRAELDGFKLIYKPATTPDEKDVTMQAALKDATESDAALAMFIATYRNYPDGALGGEWLNIGGLYGDLYEASKELWGEIPSYYDQNMQTWYSNVNTDQLEAITYDQWKKEVTQNSIWWYINVYNDATFMPYAPSSGNGYGMYILGDGLANDYFAATYLRDDLKEYIANSALYEPFSTKLQAIYDANKVIIDDYNAALYALSLQKAELENAAGIETAKYDVIITEKEQLQGIMEKYTVTEAGTTNEQEFAAALKAIKNKIIDIEGGVKDPEGESKEPSYIEGSLANIAKEIAICDNYLKAITDKTYPTLKNSTIAAFEMKISLKEQEKEILKALYDAAKAKKDKLLNGLTGTPAQ